MHAGEIVRTARQARKMTLAELGTQRSAYDRLGEHTGTDLVHLGLQRRSGRRPRPGHRPDRRSLPRRADRPGGAPERRARLLTDLARVWAQADDPGRAIGALLAAHGHARTEVRDRSSIRGLAIELVRRHPAGTGADRLALILAGT